MGLYDKKPEPVDPVALELKEIRKELKDFKERLVFDLFCGTMALFFGLCLGVGALFTIASVLKSLSN